MSSYKYRLRNVKTENSDDVLATQDIDEGPFVITVKTLSGDLMVLATGNGSDVKYDEDTDTLYNLYSMISRNFFRINGRVFNRNNESDMKEALQYRRNPSGVNVLEIQLLDADEKDEKDNDLTLSVFNYLGEDHKRYDFSPKTGPGGFNLNRNKFKCLKNDDDVVYTPLPRRNLNLYLLISDEDLIG